MRFIKPHMDLFFTFNSRNHFILMKIIWKVQLQQLVSVNWHVNIKDAHYITNLHQTSDKTDWLCK